MKKNPVGLNTDLLIQAALETFANLVIIDNHSRIVYINQSYSDLLGKSKEEIIGKDCRDIIPGTRLPVILKSEKEEIGDLMTLYNHKKGKTEDLICSRFPLKENGKTVGAAAITTFENISDLQRLTGKIKKIEKENREYKEKLDQIQYNPLEKIIGSSTDIKKAKTTIRDFARSNLPILLTGETGVGKEVFANAIQALSQRNMNNYVRINCAAIPAELLESELFGYEEGAFTGARKGGKKGRFELADKGTLLLDEIGEMPMPLQAKLLRVLQEHEIERIGGSKPIHIDVRLICSTNRDLSEMIRSGKFREDLYYRINTVELYIPPLRKRPEDLPALCSHFIRKSNADNLLHTTGITDEVLHLLRQYSWPGNVRELEHTIERLAFLSPDGPITMEHCGFLIDRINGQMHLQDRSAALRSASETDSFLPGQSETASGFSAETSVSSNNPGSLKESKSAEKRNSNAASSYYDSSSSYSMLDLRQHREKAEISDILNALKETGGNKSKAAKLLGISRTLLYRKLKKYGITI